MTVSLPSTKDFSCSQSLHSRDQEQNLEPHTAAIHGLTQDRLLDIWQLVLAAYRMVSEDAFTRLVWNPSKTEPHKDT